jgi:hypothetical protein
VGEVYEFDLVATEYILQYMTLSFGTTVYIFLTAFLVRSVVAFLDI